MDWVCTDEVRYRWETWIDDTRSWQVEMCPAESSDSHLWWVLVLRESYADDGSETLGDVYGPIQRVARVALPTERICRFAIDEVVRGIYDPFEAGDARIAEVRVQDRNDPLASLPPEFLDAMLADFMAYVERESAKDNDKARSIRKRAKRRAREHARRQEEQDDWPGPMLRVYDSDGSRLYAVRLSRSGHLADDLMSVLPAKKCDKGVRLTRPCEELGLTRDDFAQGCKALRKGKDPHEVFASLLGDSDL